MTEIAGQTVPEEEGIRYLRLLGLESLAEQPFQASDGSQFAGKDFLDVCGKHARPALRGFEALPADDPRRQLVADHLKSYIIGLVGVVPSTPAQ